MKIMILIHILTHMYHHTLKRQIPAIKPILQLPPPRTTPISIPTPKSSDNNNHTSYKQPPTLYPIQEQDTINEDQVEETCLDPSIDCITSTYTIVNQHTIPEPIPQPTFATITTHPDTSYHQYSQVPSIYYLDNVHNIKIKNTQPLISPPDRVSSTLPSNISLNLDVLQKTVGFQNMQKNIKYYKETALQNLHIQNLDRDPIHDRGMHATKPKEQSNKTPLTISDDDVWHYDIAYGIGTAIGGIKYTLVITGRANRYTFLYPLTDMKDTSILLTMKHFVAQLGRKPRKCMWIEPSN